MYKKIFVPTNILKKNKNKYNKTEWLHVYTYIDKRTLRERYDIEYNTPICVNSKYIKRDTLYKDSSLSNKSEIYDYYKILKDEISKNHEEIGIVKKRIRFKNNIHMAENVGIKFIKLKEPIEVRFD